MTRDKSHRTRSVRRRAAGAAVLLAAPLALGVATPAHAVAETRYVAATGNDAVAAIPNDCSQSALPCRTIGHAVDEASSRDTVSIATGTYAESLNVTESLTFVGTGSTMPTITGDAGGDPTMWVDGDGASAPITVSLSDISLSGNTHAGALQVEAATTDLTDSKVSDNAGTGAFVTAGSTMTATGSTINGNLFGFYESGSLTLKNSTVSGSVMDGITVTGESVLITGSVISDSGGYGISQDGGAVSVTGSTISGNGKGGVVVGFNSAQPVTAHITRSTLSGNTVAGAAASPGGKVIITRSTVSGTRASTTGPQPYGGGLLAAGGNVQASEVTLYGNTNFGVGADGTTGPAGASITNSTITGTKKGSGTSSLVGGLATAGTGALLAASGTIDATNLTPDCGGAITDNGYNLASDTTCRLRAKGSRQHAAAKLGTLVGHGGPTKTVLPGLTSPARNAIPFGKAGCVKGATDQRGKPRRSPAAGKCDIGSVEATVVNPRLRAKVVGHKAGGRYHGAVIVKYHCTVRSARLTHKCPKPTHLRSHGKHHVKKTIHAVDGGTATVKLTITIS